MLGRPGGILCLSMAGLRFGLAGLHYAVRTASPPPAPLPSSSDYRAQRLEHRFVLLEPGAHFVIGDPAVWIETFGLQFQFFAPGRIGAALVDTREDLRVSAAQSHDAFRPEPGLRCAGHERWRIRNRVRQSLGRNEWLVRRREVGARRGDGFDWQSFHYDRGRWRLGFPLRLAVAFRVRLPLG